MVAVTATAGFVVVIGAVLFGVDGRFAVVPVGVITSAPACGTVVAVTGTRVVVGGTVEPTIVEFDVAGFVAVDGAGVGTGMCFRGRVARAVSCGSTGALRACHHWNPNQPAAERMTMRTPARRAPT